MHIYIQDSDRNYMKMKMNKNASVWTKLKFNFNFVRFLLSVCTEQTDHYSKYPCSNTCG